MINAVRTYFANRQANRQANFEYALLHLNYQIRMELRNRYLNEVSPYVE